MPTGGIGRRHGNPLAVVRMECDLANLPVRSKSAMIVRAHRKKVQAGG